jgi:hypothetical protein
MATYDQLNVYKDALSLTVHIVQFCKGMDKAYRYSLGERLTDLCLNLFTLVYRINCERGNRQPLFVQAREQVESIRLLVRVLKELNLVGMSRFVKMNDEVENISRQLTGWQKASGSA